MPCYGLFTRLHSESNRMLCHSIGNLVAALQPARNNGQECLLCTHTFYVCAPIWRSFECEARLPVDASHGTRPTTWYATFWKFRFWSSEPLHLTAGHKLVHKLASPQRAASSRFGDFAIAHLFHMPLRRVSSSESLLCRLSTESSRISNEVRNLRIRMKF